MQLPTGMLEVKVAVGIHWRMDACDEHRAEAMNANRVWVPE